MTNLLDAADNPLVQRLGWTLVHFVWQGALIGVCVSLGLLLFRRSASATRYNLLLAGFGLMALAPIVTFLVVTPAMSGLEEPTILAQSITDPPAPETSTTLIQDAGAFPPAEPPGLAPQWPSPPRQEPFANGEVGDRIMVPLPALEPAVIPERTLAQRVMPVLPYLVTGWLLGVVLLSLRLIGAWRRIQLLVKCDVSELETRWKEVAQRLLTHMQIQRTVRFLESQRAVVPVVIGWLKPVVVVPTSILTNLTFEEAEALLAHELAHIRRWDEIVNLLQTVFETLFFYHPAVWFVSSRLRQEREHCCDDLAAEVVGDRLVYSRALVAAAQLATERPHRLAVASTGGKLQQRIQRLLQGAPAHRVKKRWPAVVVLGIAAFLTVGILACNQQTGASTSAGSVTADEVDNPTADEADRWRAEIERMAAEVNPVVQEPVIAGPDAIVGHVFDPAGNPVASALVFLLDEEQKLNVFQVNNENRPSLDGGPERRATTDSDGRFALADGGDWNRIAIVADQCPLWALDRSEMESLDDIQVKLPETGEISVIVDLPEEEETVELWVGLQSFDDRIWRRDMLLNHDYEVSNPAETVLTGLPPGFYSIERIDDLDFGTHGHLTDCERQIIWVSAEKPAEVSFSRQFGVRVNGIVKGLDRDDFGFAMLTTWYDGPEEALRPDGSRSRMMTSFDSMKLDRDGTFTTQPMPPGEYRFQVSTFLDDRTSGRPDLHGGAVVNVPATGELDDVTIEVGPTAAEPESIAGRVLDPAGTPVDGARVYLLSDTQKLTIFNVQNELRPRLEGDGPERRATTDANGRFMLAEGDDWNRIAVVADQCPLWVLERSELEALDDIQVQLPEPGEISVIVDIPDTGESVELMIALRTFDGRVWGRDKWLKNDYAVENPAETIISGIPPGTYAVERIDHVDFDTHRLMHGCERTILEVTSGETGEVSFSRQFGVPVSGVVQGLDRDDFGHASLAVQYWGPEEEPMRDGRRSRMLTTFDGIKLDRDGTFTTQPMPPGEYSFYVSAFLDGRTGGSPDLRRSIVVTVPATGEVRDVIIEVSPDGDLEYPDPPDDPDRMTAGLEAPADPNPTEENRAVESSDSTPQELVAGIEQSMQQFLSVEYSAEYSEVRDTNAFRDSEPGERFTRTGSYTYRSDGRRWFADEHGFGHSIDSSDTWPTHELSGFDGDLHYSREEDIVTLGEDTLAVERRALHHVFWAIGKNWSWLKSALESPSAGVKDHPVINGHTCVNIHSEKTWPGGEIQFQYEIVISPEQSFLPIRCVIRRNGELETTWTMEDLAQTDDGLWYPGTIVTEHANPFPTESMRLTVTALEVRDDFTDADFAYTVPAGVDVVDYRSGSVYFNDPWWPDLKTLLSERFAQPTPWLSPTDEMGSYADGAIDSEPAPTIEASEWINGDPGNWDRPDREFTVLFFFGGRAIAPTPKWLAGLRALQGKYGEGGLELMGIVSSEAAEGARQTAREYGLTFPIAVADPSEETGSFGRPHDAFGLQHYAGVFVIDPDGIVHIVNSPQLEGDAQMQLEPLVQQLMGLPADEFARPETGLSRPQWDVVVAEWRSLRRSSAANASLSGLLTGTDSDNLINIDLTLTPMLRMVSGHTPYGHTQQIDDADSLTVACEGNGRYEFPELMKGTYRLTIFGPGIDKQEHFVAVAAEDSDVTLDLDVP